MTVPSFIIGDVHGHCEKLVGLLRDAGLVAPDLTWAGGDARLFLLGDYVDRGPDGLGAIDLLMRLRQEAAAAGGHVEALLGNHDLMLLAAHRFREEMPPGADLSFWDVWWRNGGRLRDLKGLTPERIFWLAQRPALVRVGDTLLQHADSTFYAEYGQTIAGINSAIAEVMLGDDYDTWAELVVAFVRRHEFDDRNGGSTETAAEYLDFHGAKQLLHGHTPIPYMGRGISSPITAPVAYADGLCLNLDGGMFLGEPGFVYQLPDDPDAP